MTMTKDEFKGAFTLFISYAETFTKEAVTERKLQADAELIKKQFDSDGVNLEALKLLVYNYIYNLFRFIAQSLASSETSASSRKATLMTFYSNFLANPIVLEYNLFDGDKMPEDLYDNFVQLVKPTSEDLKLLATSYLSNKLFLIRFHHPLCQIEGDFLSEFISNLSDQIQASDTIENSLRLLSNIFADENNNHQLREVIISILFHVSRIYPRGFNHIIINNIVKHYDNLKQEQKNNTETNLLEQTLNLLAYYFSKNDNFVVQDALLKTKQLPTVAPFVAEHFNIIQFKALIDACLQANVLNESSDIISKRVRKNVSDLLEQIDSCDNLVAIYVLLKNSKHNINKQREFANLTLNGQIEKYQSLLDDIIGLIDISNAMQARFDVVPSNIVESIKKSRDLTLVAKLSKPYFSNRDYNDYICQYINSIKFKTDGSLRIESQRTTSILDDIVDELGDITSTEIIRKLTTTIDELEKKKETLNHTLNRQINYAMNKTREIIEFCRTIEPTLSERASIVIPGLLTIIGLIPEADVQIRALISKLYFDDSQLANLTDQAMLYGLDDLYSSIVAIPNPVNNNAFFANNKSEMLKVIRELRTPILQSIEDVNITTQTNTQTQLDQSM